MEELQDAIEDAQYMHAMHHDAPQPTSAWVFPTDEQLEVYMTSLRGTDPKLLSEADAFCAQPLGLHLFMKFVKQRGDHDSAAFIIELATLRVSHWLITVKW